MKIASVLMRSSLRGAGVLLALCGSTHAATSQATDNQATLMGKASIVFSGTVSQLAATSFADVPKSAQTIVVRVDAILKKPAAVSLKRGDSVTVEIKDASAFSDGTQATFYTEGWIFGSGVAVKELGHVLGKANEPVAAPGAGTHAPGQAPGQLSDQELKERMNESDFVVVGRVTDVHKWNAPKVKSGSPLHVTEHDPDWHEAVVEIQSVLKGGQVKGHKVVVRFPTQNDVAWAHSPKFTKNQRGIFCLNRDKTTGAKPGSKGVYTCLGHGDALPLSEEARVRALLRNQ